MDNRQQILNNIICIKKDDCDISILSIKLEFSTNKYSSKKNSIYHIVLNDKHLSKHDKFYFKYKCVTCQMEHLIATTQMLRKINKGSIQCNLCKNNDTLKTMKQSEFMLNNKINTKTDSLVQTIKAPIIPPKSLIDLKNESINMFEKYDDDFKNNYFSFHLTVDDYTRISKNIKSFHNGKYIMGSDSMEYWPIYKTNNQMNFTTMLYHKEHNTIFKAHQPIMICDNCNKEWRAKSIERFKNCLKIMCKDCSFVSKTFKIIRFQNCNNELVLYQSKLELKFINWCNNNNILVVNGPTIPYIFENKDRKYKVDFMINSKVLIEIKDNHIWHINDMKSGKWQAKEEAVNNMIKNGIYTKYYMITPKDWLDSLKKLSIELNKI